LGVWMSEQNTSTMAMRLRSTKNQNKLLFRQD
jgi:hypothetical protein